MYKVLLYKYLFLASNLFLVACSSEYSEATEMGHKWCTCNERMGKLYEEMNASDNQLNKDAIAVKILAEQANVLQCMGGEKKLRLLNDQFSGTDFQKYFDKARLYKCPERVKLLSKKGNSVR
jgi:hypothetical protein